VPQHAWRTICRGVHSLALPAAAAQAVPVAEPAGALACKECVAGKVISRFPGKMSCLSLCWSGKFLPQPLKFPPSGQARTRQLSLRSTGLVRDTRARGTRIMDGSAVLGLIFCVIALLAIR
jgi:hypothetical protein